jgi:hypothetical protein
MKHHDNEKKELDDIPDLDKEPNIGERRKLNDEWEEDELSIYEGPEDD